MNTIRSSKSMFDDAFVRVFDLFRTRQEPYWFIILGYVSILYVSDKLPQVGNGSLDGLVNLYKGAVVPLLSLLVVFLVWPQVKPGADKVVVNGYLNMGLTIVATAGLWYVLGVNVGLLLAVAVLVFAAMVTELYGLNRLLVMPFFVGLTSPIFMGFAGSTTNVLAVRIDMALTSLGVPIRGWDEVLAVLALLVVTFSVIALLVSLHGSTIYGRRAEQAHQPVSAAEYKTQPNIIRVGGTWLAITGSVMMVKLMRKFGQISAMLFNKGKVAAKEGIQQKKMDRLQKRTDAELAAAGLAGNESSTDSFPDYTQMHIQPDDDSAVDGELMEDLGFGQQSISNTMFDDEVYTPAQTDSVVYAGEVVRSN